MKTQFFLILVVSLMILNDQNFAQGVAISNDNSNPDPSAMLDVKSINRGLLIPSMTTAQRDAIVSPAEGLIIYNTTTSDINQRQNGNWMFLLNNDYWVGGGTGWMFNIGDNIGINTAGPSERLDVNGNIRTTGSMNIDNTSAILQFKSGGINTGFVQISGENLRLGTNSGNTNGNVVVRLNGDDRITFSPSGDIDVEGKITNVSETGNAPLTPLCYGKINPAGLIVSGTGNFSVIRQGEGTYRIYCSGINAGSLVVATGHASNVNVGASCDNGFIQVYTYNIVTELNTDSFIQFVAYAP
ncbi:MAG: hypothetical protein IPF68_16070 [Bacteroidales bacterium]|nr:hypothetical protein [Bacteroidales bacterium]